MLCIWIKERENKIKKDNPDAERFPCVLKNHPFRQRIGAYFCVLWLRYALIHSLSNMILWLQQIPFAAAGAAAVAAAAVVCKAVAEITILLKLHALKCVSNAFGIFIMEPLFFLSPSIAFFDAS